MSSIRTCDNDNDNDNDNNNDDDDDDDDDDDNDNDDDDVISQNRQTYLSPALSSSSSSHLTSNDNTSLSSLSSLSV